MVHRWAQMSFDTGNPLRYICHCSAHLATQHSTRKPLLLDWMIWAHYSHRTSKCRSTSVILRDRTGGGCRSYLAIELEHWHLPRVGSTQLQEERRTRLPSTRVGKALSNVDDKAQLVAFPFGYMGPGKSSLYKHIKRPDFVWWWYERTHWLDRIQGTETGRRCCSVAHM